ncbi:SRF-TF-domain-containing protein [Metschnikowia bicuspidata var. bicuspidata NRRL YB-4993]|uniref:SRF-TF-domain-containing protein n=1 Tax=Metschnikowia bicuspidata var. bicuspidata NRRL YB-4993 TaxID=869754 RepID=A0A1A0H9X3_9ASCO|nr:SRF-TF-domain-containing protein [Metschnikowia bicuspidata var. bicuspidata NRRL YB-4993]OBA20677.1 SRF-TF-domain-containing protein [Metschnikowia bicuspidata var. bicuspidata NRRL YB-4993]
MSEITDPSKLEGSDETLAGAPGPQFNRGSVSGLGGDDDDDDEPAGGKQQKERRKIEIKFIQDKSRRHITFSKRKAGIMKKAYELSVLTGTQVLLLVVSETGLVYTFTTPKLQPLVTKSEGKNLIQACLNAPEEGLGDEQGDQSEANSPELPEQSPAPQKHHAPVANVAHQVPPPAVPHPQQLPPTHLPHGMPYQGQGHPQQGLPMPQAGGYNDPYQYFGNMGNGNMQNQQQYQ